MMKTGTAPTGFRLVLVCIAVLLAAGLAYPTAAGAQGRGQHDIPEQLWEIYPLDPTKTDADAPETVQPQPSPPAQTETDSVQRFESPDAQAQPSGESNSGRSPVVLPLLGALLGFLVGLLLIAAARSGAFAITGGYLARGGAVVVSPLRTLPGLVRHVGHLLLWPLRALAVVVSYFVGSVGTTVAAAGQASRTVLRERRVSLRRLLLYAFTALVSAGVGLLVTLLVQP